MSVNVMENLQWFPIVNGVLDGVHLHAGSVVIAFRKPGGTVVTPLIILSGTIVVVNRVTHFTVNRLNSPNDFLKMFQEMAGDGYARWLVEVGFAGSPAAGDVANGVRFRFRHMTDGEDAQPVATPAAAPLTAQEPRRDGHRTPAFSVASAHPLPVADPVLTSPAFPPAEADPCVIVGPALLLTGVRVYDDAEAGATKPVEMDFRPPDGNIVEHCFPGGCEIVDTPPCDQVSADPSPCGE